MLKLIHFQSIQQFSFLFQANLFFLGQVFYHPTPLNFDHQNVTVVLEPGGLHLMLMRLKSRPGKGDEVALTLEFERAGAVEVRAPVVATHHGH